MTALLALALIRQTVPMGGFRLGGRSNPDVALSPTETAAPALSAAVSAPTVADPQRMPLPAETRTVPFPDADPAAAAPILMPTKAPLPATRTVPLANMHHMWQTWNNCGPATLAMVLGYYGLVLDQSTVGASLRANSDDKNVSPTELATYARGQGLHAQVGINGSAELLRRLIDAGVPILIETWLDPDSEGGLGHYRLLVGYDDVAGAWIAYDAYVGAGLVNPDGPYAGIRLPYEETDALWQVFNRTYLLVYGIEEAASVEAILGESKATDSTWQAAVANAQSEIDRDPDDPFAWFNLGSSLTALGAYGEAAAAYDRARQIGLPWRMLWYQFGPFEAYHHAGRHQDVLALTDAVLSPDVQIEELHYWRGRSLEAIGDAAGAAQAWQAAANLNPAFGEQLDMPPSSAAVVDGAADATP